MSKKMLNIVRVILVLMIVLVVITPLLSDMVVFSKINTILSNKEIYFVIILLLILTVIEVITIKKEKKRKKMENMMNLKLDEFLQVKDNKELSVAIENSIKDKLNEIRDAKNDYKKIDELEKTINIPLEEIQKGLNVLGKKEEEVVDEELDKTVILFDNKDIKEEIQEELKIRKTKKLSTGVVDKV